MDPILSNSCLLFGVTNLLIQKAVSKNSFKRARSASHYSFMAHTGMLVQTTLCILGTYQPIKTGRTEGIVESKHSIVR